MIRWIARIVGLLMLLVFMLVLANLQRRLVAMQESQRPAPTTTP